MITSERSSPAGDAGTGREYWPLLLKAADTAVLGPASAWAESEAAPCRPLRLHPWEGKTKEVECLYREACPCIFPRSVRRSVL